MTTNGASEWFDPEQAGIILDRLAGELVRAASGAPAYRAELQRDAREFLPFLRVALSDRNNDLAFAIPRINRDVPPEALVGILRELARQLLALAEE